MAKSLANTFLGLFSARPSENEDKPVVNFDVNSVMDPPPLTDSDWNIFDTQPEPNTFTGKNKTQHNQNATSLLGMHTATSDFTLSCYSQSDSVTPGPSTEKTDFWSQGISYTPTERPQRDNENDFFRVSNSSEANCKDKMKVSSQGENIKSQKRKRKHKRSVLQVKKVCANDSSSLDMSSQLGYEKCIKLSRDKKSDSNIKKFHPPQKRMPKETQKMMKEITEVYRVNNEDFTSLIDSNIILDNIKKQIDDNDKKEEIKSIIINEKQQHAVKGCKVPDEITELSDDGDGLTSEKNINEKETGYDTLNIDEAVIGITEHPMKSFDITENNVLPTECLEIPTNVIQKPTHIVDIVDETNNADANVANVNTINYSIDEVNEIDQNKETDDTIDINENKQRQFDDIIDKLVEDTISQSEDITRKETNAANKSVIGQRVITQDDIDELIDVVRNDTIALQNLNKPIVVDDYNFSNSQSDLFSSSQLLKIDNDVQSCVSVSPRPKPPPAFSNPPPCSSTRITVPAYQPPQEQQQMYQYRPLPPINITRPVDWERKVQQQRATLITILGDIARMNSLINKTRAQFAQQVKRKGMNESTKKSI